MRKNRLGTIFGIVNKRSIAWATAQALLRLTAALALASSIAWLINDPGFETLLATLGAFGTVVGLFIEKRRR